MNAMLSATLPLPACLHTPNGPTVHRRHRVGTLDLTAAAVDRFNRLLEQAGRTEAPLDCDRLATAARELCNQASTVASPVCIRQRVRRVKAAITMLEDRQWRAEDEAAATVHLIADYVASNDDLFPDRLPTVGRLDDAILVDAAWPRLQAEIRSYFDFRRLRRMLVPSGAARQRFDRDSWLQARADELALLHQWRRVREASYLPAVPRLFRVR